MTPQAAAAIAARTLEEVMLLRAEQRILRDWFIDVHVAADKQEQTRTEAEQAMAGHAAKVREWIAGLVTPPNTAELPDLLPGCAAEAEEDCGRRNPEACLTFPTGQRMCRGCGFDPVTGESAKK